MSFSFQEVVLTSLAKAKRAWTLIRLLVRLKARLMPDAFPKSHLRDETMNSHIVSSVTGHFPVPIAIRTAPGTPALLLHYFMDGGRHTYRVVY